MPEKLRQAILSQNPTEQQKDAIFEEKLEFLLRAAPGSGKTWTSCRRFIWRGANWPYSAGGLALLSFTNVAIREFKEATVKLGRRDLLADPNYVGTFDSFVERYIIAPFGHLITGSSKRPQLFPGPRPGDRKNSKLKAWVNGRGRKVPVMAWDIIPYMEGKKQRYKTAKGSEVQDGSAVRELLSLGYYTHGQRVFWACQLLFDRPHIANLLARRFPEIIVDEAQDTNAWLLVLLNYLRSKGARITLVGDPDQCIYEFSQADVTSLPNLRKKWGISEKPLSRSFRCNNRIADAARNIGGNAAFTGNGDAAHDMYRPFVVRESSGTYLDAVEALQKITGSGAVSLDAAAVICRGHGQLESVRGLANYRKLQGKTKELATAAFFRDSHHNYRGATQAVEQTVRGITGDDELWSRVDEDPGSPEGRAVSLAIWRFVKDPKRLPSVSENGTEWIQTLRTQLGQLITEIGISGTVSLGAHIKKTGLPKDGETLPLFESEGEFPTVRQDTIHQVKGESIDAVLVIGTSRFWNSVVKAVTANESTEDRRLAYVAMTRARHQLVVALPASHFDTHADQWTSWGFSVFPEKEE